ncbi:hypothetical protein [Ornithinimicrobium kibberense]|uniref:hypothetical protein n=1 Tax=Ornithinimicrobium kibberense TaxID=282060 RepID=UPI0036237746
MRVRRWRPAASWFASSSQASMAARTRGHPRSVIANQVVSRLRPLTTIAWRHVPSSSKPSRRAARREGALRLSHFHS